ncbi:MAG: chitobiase/beta-hexosaminidase C-terminal domain-containing protein [Clostridiales bacterium]|nr:chitobiase/beta-hexosaminidase C-terminal domain-containing protein [Clostridiales bacterium]
MKKQTTFGAFRLAALPAAILLIAALLAGAACGGADTAGESGGGKREPGAGAGPENPSSAAASVTAAGTGPGNTGDPASGALGGSGITISGDGIEGELTFTFAELLALPDAAFEHAYSTINNWPASRFYAGRGIRVAAILEAAGVLDTASLITFRSVDSYETALTREQLLGGARYYYPFAAEGSDEDAEIVEPILAYEFKEGSADLANAAPGDFCLLFGQRSPFEHTNPAFVENISEILVSAAPPGQWREAGIFPASGRIEAGDSIKLQHPEFGLVKMFYTLDGSEPTELSTMYNPSTYRPELNKPIVFTENAVLKVLVTGYGREDSPIAVYEIIVED